MNKPMSNSGASVVTTVAILTSHANALTDIVMLSSP
jgi:hypothetical protein